MIKTFGSELRELRTILKLSQRQLTNNDELLSQSSLQRIEKNEQMPSFDLAMLLINQLEVNLEELSYRLNGFDVSEKEKLIDEFRNIGSSANVKGITLLLNKMKSFLEKESSEIIKRLTLILQALLVFQEEQKFEHARAIVKPIWDKLQKQDEWLYNDMLVVSNILFLFEEEAYFNMKNLLIEQIKKYSGLKNVKRIHIITLVNSVLYMKKKESLFRS
ncbi:Rgg/GadR/MutR family transcriptional regulator [Listeria fleischmannii]|uniref:Transcriptional regulator n=1 Tax=Listeria fleischmannii FSL S10-1203 TaxID=1265822 RepID=W7DH52_9LIST|nr:Rgg/GadR/MutR family transcriptional regulator [Listeria fleischmannii]EUJ44678.1 transcriptional regulator [Listeria fleischmannii FSL S10-1203]